MHREGEIRQHLLDLIRRDLQIHPTPREFEQMWNLLEPLLIARMRQGYQLGLTLCELTALRNDVY